MNAKANPREASGSIGLIAAQALHDPAEAELIERIAQHAVVVKTRKRQRLAAEIERSETIYLVRSGVLLVAASAGTEPGNRQIMGILYSGDIFRSLYVPPLPGVGLTALVPGELLRLRWTAFEEIASRDIAIARLMMRRCARLQARTNMHVAALAALSGEARVKAFLLELALRTGTGIGRTLSCDLPFSRADIADYLALNADTLSRIMSRLRSAGLITTLGRSRLIIKDIGGFTDCPFADALQDLYGMRLAPSDA